MQHMLSLIAAATALSATTPGMPGNTGISASAPIAVTTCAVRDLYDYATAVEFGPPISIRALALSFRNTDDIAATQVAFDVVHGGERTSVIDRGRFSRGALIEHQFDGDFGAGYSSEPDTCTVASITFADGRRWTPTPNAMTTSFTIR